MFLLEPIIIVIAATAITFYMMPSVREASSKSQIK
jgi:hypothetical protein